MKFLIAFALFAVASASIIPPAVVASTDPEIQEILAAIHSPSTDPATAAALEQLLLDVLGLSQYEPISVGPALVDPSPIAIGPALVDSPISIGPALIDFPLPDGGAVTVVDPTPVMPAPVGPAANAPLVQIILNIKSASDVALEAPVGPVGGPVQVVDNAPEPVIIVDQPIVADPVIIVDQPVVADPVIIVDQPIPVDPVVIVDKPEAAETVIVAQPIITVPAITLPDILN